MEELDGASKHFLSTHRMYVPNVELLLLKQNMDAIWENYQCKLKWIENLPKELLKYEFEYRK